MGTCKGGEVYGTGPIFLRNVHLITKFPEVLVFPGVMPSVKSELYPMTTVLHRRAEGP